MVMGGMAAGQAVAAPVTFNSTGAPISVEGDFNALAYTMAVIDPTNPSSGGLLGVVDDSTGSISDGANTSSPSDTLLPGNVFFRYTDLRDDLNDTKTGTQFGVMVGAGNGIYGLGNGFGTGARPTQFALGDVIGDGDALLTADTNPLDPVNAVQVDMDDNDNDVIIGDAFLGFQLGGHNGFVHVRENNGGATNNYNNFQLLGWGYETEQGVAITAEYVASQPPSPAPVPASLALLALGAAGVGAMRSRRRMSLQAANA